LTKKKRRDAAAATSQGVLLRRRVALGLHVALQGCVVVGSQGPWWDVMIGGERVLRHVGYDPARASPMEPLAALAAFAGIVAFFFASYDLVADANLQAPIFAASLTIVVAAGVLLHRVTVAPQTIEEITEEVLRAAPPSPDGVVAPVDSNDPLRRLQLSLPALKPAWGLSLLVAAAPLMLILSVYLTFFAERASESS
jgi:hypothetical protein